MRVAAIALLPFLLLASAPDRALAQAKTEEETQHRLQKPNYARGGFYIGAEGLYAIENSPVTGTTTDNQYISSGGFQLRFGGRHNRWLATELDVIYIHKFESETEDFLAWGLTVAERLYMTKGRFQPFLTVGAGFLSLRSPSRRTSSSSSSSSGPGPGFAMTFGMGAEMFANENFIITLMSNYQLTIGNIKDHDFLTVGIGIQLF
jgi:opacity protein-like surface antigen